MLDPGRPGRPAFTVSVSSDVHDVHWPLYCAYGLSVLLAIVVSEFFHYCITN